MTQSQEAFTQDSTYTLPLWRARLIIQDAVIKRYQDTIILNLEHKASLFKDKLQTQKNDFESLLKVEGEKYQKETEISQLEAGLKDHFKAESKKYKRQRNLTVIGAITLVGLMVLRR